MKMQTKPLTLVKEIDNLLSSNNINLKKEFEACKTDFENFNSVLSDYLLDYYAGFDLLLPCLIDTENEYLLLDYSDLKYQVYPKKTRLTDTAGTFLLYSITEFIYFNFSYRNINLEVFKILLPYKKYFKNYPKI